MKTRIIGLMVAVGFTIGFAAACNVEQPPAACPTPHASSFIKLTRTEGPADQPCGQLTGESLGFGKYNKSGSDEATLAIKTETAGALSGDPRFGDDDTALSIGDFPTQPTTEANGTDFCVAQELSPATITLAEIPDMMLPDGGVEAGEPAVNRTWKWTNVRLVSTTQVPGTQFTAELEYTEDGCTAKYTGVGVSPALHCGEEQEDGTIVPNDELCNPSALVDGGTAPACDHDTHECANPDFVLKCDTETFFCIPAGDIPSLD